MLHLLRQKPNIIYISGILLLIPALLINLGALNIFMAVDEATRGLVALEMMISNNYIAPTIHGELYYNKPPLFPWILIVFYKTFGINEWIQRLPTVISLVGLGFTVYFFVSKELGRKVGIITAFLFVTTGRILFWESLLGYIDITFAWVIYTGMMSVLYFFQRKKFLQLFLASYLFMTVGFFLKGLPAIVFQGITLLVVFISEREFKKLFTLQHLAGGFVFLIPATLYYWLLSRYTSLNIAFYALWGESAGRTGVGGGDIPGFWHLFKYPYEMFYHFLPWSLLIVFLFTRNFRKIIKNHTFLRLNLLLFVFNVIPYYTSAQKMPKYIMMLVPMIFSLCVFFYLKNKRSQKNRLPKIIEMVFLVAGILLTLGYLVIPFMPEFHVTSQVILKCSLLFLLSALLVYLYWKIETQRLVLFAIILIVGRMALGWFIWPQRIPQFEKFEEDAKRVAAITGNEPVYYYKLTMLQYGASYVISKNKWQIVQTERSSPQEGIFYITDQKGLEELKQIDDSLKIYFEYPNTEDGRTFSLVKLD